MSGPKCQEPSTCGGAGVVTGSESEGGGPEQAPVPAPRDRGDELELWPFPSAVSCARAHAAAMLREWGLGHLADDVSIIVSELTTNAVEAATETIDTRPVLLRLFMIRGWLIVEVWDANPQFPEPCKPDDEEESGRGLLLVSALSDASGYDVTADGRKAVWARIALR